MRSSIRRLTVARSGGAWRDDHPRAAGERASSGERVDRLFPGASPITHVIYIIKENRTYDQVFGDIAAAGDGTPADGDAVAGALRRRRGRSARRAGRHRTSRPNHRALALRFGLFDRFFVNSEASPDGHNWSTAAFSTDYVDKAFRWAYSGRGRQLRLRGIQPRCPTIDGRELPSGLQLPRAPNSSRRSCGGSFRT